jgi:hypothetical protein
MKERSGWGCSKEEVYLLERVVEGVDPKNSTVAIVEFGIPVFTGAESFRRSRLVIGSSASTSLSYSLS